MTSLYNRLGNLSTGDWEEGLNIIRAFQKEFQDYGGIMTPYEQSAAQREIKRIQDQYRPMVLKHLMDKIDVDISCVKVRGRDLIKAKANEVSRWDAGKLTNELQSAQMLFDIAQKAPDQNDGLLRGTLMLEGNTIAGPSKSKQEKISQLYQDAQSSGDIYKQRAMAEILSGFQTDKELIHLARQAERDLEKLHITPEIEKANEIYVKAWQDLGESVHEAKTIAPEVGEYIGVMDASPLNKKINQVDFKNGKILEPDDPDVTGISLGKMPHELT